jgi:hypothetical protein
MYGGWCTMAWIKGQKYFLDAAEARRSSKGFMCCPCRICRNNKEFSRINTLHIHLIERVSWITILFGPRMVHLEF